MFQWLKNLFVQKERSNIPETSKIVQIYITNRFKEVSENEVKSYTSITTVTLDKRKIEFFYEDTEDPMTQMGRYAYISKILKDHPQREQFHIIENDSSLIFTLLWN